MNWITDNKEWLFSGIGASFVFALCTYVFRNIVEKCRLRASTSKQVNDSTTLDKSQYISEDPPDGVKIIVGKKFVKTWTIRNVGQTVWRKRYMKCDSLPRYVRVNKEKVKMPVIKPGQEYVLSVEFSITCEGIYRSYWKMYDENNNLTFPNLEGLGVTLVAVRDDKNG